MKPIVSHIVNLNDLKLISKIKDKLQNFQFIEVDTESSIKLSIIDIFLYINHKTCKNLRAEEI